MKVFAIAAFTSLFTVVGLAQRSETPNTSPDKVTLLADSEIKTGGTVKLRGRVQVVTGSITLYADEADYNPLIGDLDARGHVHVTFKKVMPSIKIQNGNPEDMPLQNAK